MTTEAKTNTTENNNQEEARPEAKKLSFIGQLKRMPLKEWAKKIRALSLSEWKKLRAFIHEMVKKLKAYTKVHPKRSLVILVAIIALCLGLFLSHEMKMHSANDSATKTSQKQNSDIAYAMQQQSIAQGQAKAVAKLQEQLLAVEKQSKDSSASQQQLTSIQSEISALNQAMDTINKNAAAAKEAAEQSMSHQQQNAQQQQQEVSQVQNQLQAIHKQLAPVHYLPASTLPFEITSSGYWGKEMMLTIVMRDINGAYHYRLMGQDQDFDCNSSAWTIPGCSNWTLKKLNADPKYAIFENASDTNQKVKVEV